MSPIIRDQTLIKQGDYYVNVRTGVMVEIMDVDLSGTCRVQNVLEPVDSDTEHQVLTEPQISSALWRRIERQPAEPAAA